MSPQTLDGAFRGLAQARLELRKDHLDRVRRRAGGPDGPVRWCGASFLNDRPSRSLRSSAAPHARSPTRFARPPGLCPEGPRYGAPERPPLRRQLARTVTAPRAGVHLAGAPPPDQRLVDVGHADPKHARRRPRRHARVNRRQNPPPKVLRIVYPWEPLSAFQPMRLCSRRGYEVKSRADQGIGTATNVSIRTVEGVIEDAANFIDALAALLDTA